MERQPYFQSGNSDNKGSGTDKKTSGNFNIAAGPQFRAPEQSPPPVERRTIPIAPAFEGVISWRDRVEDDMRSQPESELNKSTESKENKDETKDKDEDKKETSAKPKVAPQQPELPVRAPHPISEVIAENNPAETSEDNSDSDEESDDQAIPATGVFAFPQPPQEAVPVQRGEQSLAEDDNAATRPIAPIFAPGTLNTFPAAPGRQESAPAASEADHEIPEAEITQEIPAQAWRPEQAMADVASESAAEADQGQDDDQHIPTTIPGYAAGVGPQLNQNVVFNQAPTAAPGTNYNAIPFAPIGNQLPHAPGGPGGPNQPPQNPNLFPAGAGGNLPPTPNQASYSFNQSPNSPYDPANSLTYNAAPSVPVMPIERPLPTNNRDPRVGPVAALLGLEYFARKRADRKLEKRLTKRNDQQFKKQEQQTTDTAIRMQEQQRQFSHEQERQGREMHQMQYRQEASPTPALPRPFESAPSGVNAERATAPVVVSVANQQPRAAGQAERMPMPPTAEMRQQQTQSGEHLQPESMMGEQPAIELQANQHVEHSAWHNIVVDERGHEVAGAIEYGEGFQRERQQEAIRDRMSDTGQAGSGAAGGVGFGQQQDQFGNPMLPSGMTNPTLPAGRSTYADPEHRLEATNKQASNFTNPWFWIMLLLIIAAFFTAALV